MKYFSLQLFFIFLIASLNYAHLSFLKLNRKDVQEEFKLDNVNSNSENSESFDLSDSLVKSKKLKKLKPEEKSSSLDLSEEVSLKKLQKSVDKLNKKAKKLKKEKDSDNTEIHSEEISISKPKPEYTLPEIEISNSHKIDYYYPFFYKTHIIENYSNVKQTEVTNSCSAGCLWCDKKNQAICKECQHGFYLLNNSCYSTCPDKYIADIFKKSCNTLQTTSILL